MKPQTLLTKTVRRRNELRRIGVSDTGLDMEIEELRGAVKSYNEAMKKGNTKRVSNIEKQIGKFNEDLDELYNLRKINYNDDAGDFITDRQFKFIKRLIEEVGITDTEERERNIFKETGISRRAYEKKYAELYGRETHREQFTKFLVEEENPYREAPKKKEEKITKKINLNKLKQNKK